MDPYIERSEIWPDFHDDAEWCRQSLVQAGLLT
jgi:hypothetical protein